MPGIDENTLLILHGEYLQDSSLYNVPANYGQVKVSSQQSKFGGKSLYFDGSSFISIPYKYLVLSDGDFTIDWWEYCEQGGTRFSAAYTTETTPVYGGMYLGYHGTQANASTTIGSLSGFDIFDMANAFDVTPNQWVHWAFVRNGETFKSYKNGVVFASASGYGAIAQSEQYNVVIGDHRNGDHSYFKGYIDEFRVSNVARWTSDFIPPDRPYSIGDLYSPNNLSYTVIEDTITLKWDSVGGASGYKIYRNALEIMDSEKTEVSFKATFFSETAYSVRAYNENGAGEESGISVYEEPENPIPYLITDRTNADVSTLSALIEKPLNTWTQEELEQFNSGMLKGGYWWTDLNRVTSCMEYLDKKLRKFGYESGYVPILVHPGSEPSIDENTLLLLHGEEIIDSSIYSVPLTNSGVQVSGDQSKFGGKSLYFDGNSSIQLVSDLFIPHSQDFTIDWWEYRISSTGTSASIDLVDDPGYSNFLLRHQGTQLYSSSGISSWDVVSGAKVFNLMQNQWIHTAIVKKGEMVTVYINGDPVHSYSGPLSYSGLGRVLIGRHGWNPPSDYFNGYIDEFRISNVARWTSKFTPPNEPYVVEIPGTGKKPYRWYKEDNPNISQLQQYVSNVSSIRSTLVSLKNSPYVPQSPKDLTTDMANNIEKVFGLVESAITILSKTPVACGSAICGGDYL